MNWKHTGLKLDGNKGHLTNVQLMFLNKNRNNSTTQSNTTFLALFLQVFVNLGAAVFGTD